MLSIVDYIDKVWLKQSASFRAKVGNKVNRHGSLLNLFWSQTARLYCIYTNISEATAQVINGQLVLKLGWLSGILRKDSKWFWIEPLQNIRIKAG